MRNVLFSFLGTGKYQWCTYAWDNVARSKTRYVQTAIYEHLKEQNIPLTVIVFTTDSAYKANWLDSEEEGLASAFTRLAPEAQLQLVRINNPEGEAENWALFDAIFAQIEEGDNIYFDMTHSFRAIPIVSLIVMNYARLLKKATLQKLVYGQFNGETGTILDMTNMLQLFDWTNGVDQFIRTGDASRIGQLVAAIATDSFKANNMSQQSRKSLLDLKVVVEQLDTVSLAIQTCRSEQIASEVAQLKQRIATAKANESNFIKPLVPLLDEIEAKYTNFTEDVISNSYEAARWSAEHELVQIGYTLLQENFITAICHYVQHDPNDKAYRTCINSAIKIIADNIPKAHWSGNVQLIEALIDVLPFEREQLLKYSKLTDYRNDINHGGMRTNAMKAKTLKHELTAAVENMEALFQTLQQRKVGMHE